MQKGWASPLSFAASGPNGGTLPVHALDAVLRLQMSETIWKPFP